MNSGIIWIGIMIIIVSFLNYVLKNFKEIERNINKRILKGIKLLFIIIILAVTIIIFYNKVKQMKRNIISYETIINNNKKFELYDKNIAEEQEFYKNVIKLQYETHEGKVPYIPEKFQYVEGNWDTGYVIQDEKENQFVWIPCSNIENDNILKLEKRNFTNFPLISKDSCYNEDYKEFLKSALKYGGYYVSRFEIGKEDEIAVSKFGKKVWTDINKNQAKEIATTMYKDNEDIESSLINGYAYDTMIEWIRKNNEIEVNYIDARENEILSGRNQYNNIYDIDDNVMELTLEDAYGSDIIRGFLYDTSDIENEVNELYADKYNVRYSIVKDSSNFTEDDAVAFRAVIYRKVID